MHIVLGDKYKLKTKSYEPQVWEEIINYTATILNANPVSTLSLDDNVVDADGYVNYNDTSQLYTPLPVFNADFTNYKYKQIDNGDGTATVSIIIDRVVGIRPTQIKFGDWQGITDTTKALLKIDKLNTKGMTTAYDMFYNCINLGYINTYLFDTSSVKNMSNMFYNCNALTTLDVSNWNTSKVTSMKDMFYNCNALTSLDVSNFDTSSVTNMYRMFQNCHALTTLDVSNWNTEKVTNMQSMFQNCKSLTELNLSTWNTGEVITMMSMFCNSEKLTTVGNISNWNVEKLTNMHAIFYSCKSLISLDLSNWSTDSLRHVADNNNNIGAFGQCISLQTIKFGNGFNLSKVSSLYCLFINDAKLETIEGIENFDTSKVTNMNRMFNGCRALTSLDVSNFDTSSVTNMYRMFQSCHALTTLDVSNFKTSSVTTMREMFHGCSALTSLDVSNWDTSSVTNMVSMFNSCRALTSLNVSNFDTSEVTNMEAMFHECNALTTLDVSNFVTSKVTNMRNMFKRCISLTILDLSNFDTSKVTNMGGMFRDSTLLEYIRNIKDWNVSKVVNIDMMFHNLSNLKELDLSNWKTNELNQVTNDTEPGGLFSDCFNLTKLIFGNGWDTSKVINMKFMFKNCQSLTSLDVSNFDTSSVTNMECMFKLMPDTQLTLGANFIMSQNLTTTNMFTTDVNNTTLKSRSTIIMTDCPPDTINKITNLTVA